MKKKIKVSYTMSPDILAKMRAEAERRGLSVSVFVQLAVEEYLKKGDNDNGAKVNAK